MLLPEGLKIKMSFNNRPAALERLSDGLVGLNSQFSQEGVGIISSLLIQCRMVCRQCLVSREQAADSEAVSHFTV